ncbi:MAG TPA: serine hydrolase [Candidatus Methylomirabilis sp.]|nr:serine hydrolase [Candidatus Methylomirabilis sp.]
MSDAGCLQVADCDGVARASGRRTAYWRKLGVEGNRSGHNRGDEARRQIQDRNWATPNGAVELLKDLGKGAGLSAGSRAMLMKWMSESVPGAKRLKGLLPAGTVVAHKTGTSGTREGMTRATNDIGIVTLPDGRYLAVAVFIADSRATEDVRDGVIAESAKNDL